MSISYDDLRDLPISEKLRIVELLWDDIESSQEVETIRKWHLDEAARRAAEMDAHPELALSHEELWKRLRMPND